MLLRLDNSRSVLVLYSDACEGLRTLKPSWIEHKLVERLRCTQVFTWLNSLLILFLWPSFLSLLTRDQEKRVSRAILHLWLVYHRAKYKKLEKNSLAVGRENHLTLRDLWIGCWYRVKCIMLQNLLWRETIFFRNKTIFQGLTGRVANNTFSF